MSPEDMQRTMQFLLQQQAQFSADLSKLEQKTDRIADGLIGLTSVVGQLAAAQLRTDEQLKELREQLGASNAGLAAHIGSVESHLNVLIDMFERHLREDHGHGPS
jgi:hypothetical protein